jgi:hypothetical protein
MPILFIRPLLLKAHPIYKGRSTNAITFIKLLDKGNPFHKATQQQKNQILPLGHRKLYCYKINIPVSPSQLRYGRKSTSSAPTNSKMDGPSVGITSS